MARKLLFLLLATTAMICSIVLADVDSENSVQFVAAVPMEHILPKGHEEGRKLFELEMPLRLRKAYFQELADEAEVSVRSINAYGVYSDGDFLYMPTQVAFPSKEAADLFDMKIKSEDFQLSNGIIISNKAPLQQRIPKAEEQVTIVEVEKTTVDARQHVEEKSEQPPAVPANDPEGLQAWQIGLIVAAAVVGVSIIGMLAVLVHRGRQQRRRNADNNSTADDSIFGDHFEPVDVQCIDSATSSRAPAQAADIQPPAPPSAPPAGIVMN